MQRKEQWLRNCPPSSCPRWPPISNPKGPKHRGVMMLGASMSHTDVDDPLPSQWLREVLMTTCPPPCMGSKRNYLVQAVQTSRRSTWCLHAQSSRYQDYPKEPLGFLTLALVAKGYVEERKLSEFRPCPEPQTSQVS